MFARFPILALASLTMLNTPAQGCVDFPGDEPPTAPTKSIEPPGPGDPRPISISDDIFYQIMPIAWRYSAPPHADARAPQNQYRFGNFRGIQEGLPYLKSLGVTAIWLNPIFPSAAYHGYQHGPADQINPWFGTEENFRALVVAAHSAGIKVFLDLVTYGISQDSIYFKNSVGSPASGYGTMLAFTDTGNNKFIGYDFKTWDGDTIGFINWDLRRMSAKRLVFEWSKKWLRPDVAGVDGYRLDHVWEKYNQGEGGLGYNIDSFWKEWRREVESANPRVFTFAEQHNWESFGAELLRTSKGERVHDAVFTKPFEAAAREALREERAEKIYLSMAATLTACPDGYTFMGIIGDHDVDRLGTAIGAGDHAGQPGHSGRAKAAAAVLMLQPFPPIIYFGDELGMLGAAGKFDSDANDIPRREPMKWNATAGESKIMSNYFALHKGAFEARYSKDGDGRSIEEQDGAADSLLNTYRALAKIRGQYPALRSGTYVAIMNDAPAVWCFVKQHKAGDVLVAVNLSGGAVKATLQSLGTRVLGMPMAVEVGAYGFVVLPLKK